MCAAIPLGRRSNGPQGTRFGRSLREWSWRWTTAAARLLPLATRVGALTLGLTALAVGLEQGCGWLASAILACLVLTASICFGGHFLPLPLRSWASARREGRPQRKGADRA
jgi:hypothetical protein